MGTGTPYLVANPRGPEAEPMTPEELYLQLADLVAEMPDLANSPITPEINRWLGRASAVVELSATAC